MERTTTATMAALLHDCFCLDVTGLSFDLPPTPTPPPPLAEADSRAAPVLGALLRWSLPSNGVVL